MIAIFKRELASYMRGVLGPSLIAIVLAAAGGLSALYQVLFATTRFEPVLNLLQLALLAVVPLLAMRGCAAQKHSRVDRFLYSLPLPTWAVVLGKYLAALAVLGIACGVLALYPLVLSLLGLTSLGSTYVALLGFFLLGAVTLAVCTLLSSLASSQPMAWLLSLGGALLLYLPSVLSEQLASGKVLSTILSSLSPFARFSNMCNGVFDLTTVVYDLSLVVLFLYLGTLVAERRRCR